MLLDKNGKRYRLLASFSQRAVVQPLGGHWDAHHGWWSLETVPDALLQVAGLDVTDAARRQLTLQRDRRDLLLSLHSATDVPVTFGCGLDSYQRVGVKFLATAGRAILGDRPGSGKTATAIRAACEIGAQRVLVVTLKSLFGNTRAQLDLWLPPTVDTTFEITNYEQVVRHPDRFHRPYDALIVDECYAISNRKARRSQALFKLAQAVEYVWMLTGTLIRSRPSELWMPLHTLYPSRYSSFWAFVNRYCELAYNQYSSSPRPTVIVGMKAGMEQELAEELAPVLLRRVDMGGLPPVTRETIIVELTGKQRDLYRKMREEFFVVLDSATLLHAPSVVAQLVRLRQIACSPTLIGSYCLGVKTETIMGLLEFYAPDYKTLVFTTFVPYADLLTEKLAPYGAVKVTGAVPQRQRDAAFETFAHDPRCRVLVGTYGVTSRGHNIQVADIVVLADKPWVPDTVEQAEDRAVRRGRGNPVHVISLVAAGTVDEHIEAVLGSKVQLISKIDAVTQIVAAMQKEQKERK